MVPSDTNNPDGHTDALASDTIIDIEFAPQITSEVEPADPSNERPEMETIDPTHEAHTSNAHHTLLSTLHSEQPLEEPTEYHELHLNDSKIKPFFAVDMDELTLAFRKRGIYNEQEKENETFQAPTPVRLVRPLSKIVTLAPGNGSILTPSSSPCETPLASSSFEAPLSSTHDEDKEKLSVIKESLADTKNTMLDNLKSLVERGPELENLQQQSVDLERKTSVFRKRAKKAEKNIWIKRMSINYIVYSVLLIIFIVGFVALLKVFDFIKF